MSNELLSALKSHLNKHAERALDSSSIDRLLNSTFIGNKESHNGSFQATMGDCKALWSDVLELRKVFYCEKCNKYVANKYYDTVKKKIRCSCAEKEYEWKY